MGASESSEDPDYYDPLPPTHSSTLFVIRNGQYEPQNLMPVLPRADMMDFDGFMARRAARGLNPCPPEMKQASLLKNALSVRRDSARAVLRPREAVVGLGVGDVEASTNAENELVLRFTFDATKTGTLSLHLLVTEAETLLELPDEIKPEIEEPGAKGKKILKRGKNPTSIKLVPRGRLSPPVQSPLEALDKLNETVEQAEEEKLVALETRPVAEGLGQVFESLPINLACFPLSELCFNPNHRRRVPIAICLEVDTEEGETSSVQYTYISLQSSPNDNDVSATVYSQKLQFGSQCFVLHEVFGVTSRIQNDTDLEGGNNDCVICLSEPRDTAVLPCRHMCFCSYCAGIVRLQCDKCPVCRQKVQSLLQFKRDPDALDFDGAETGLECVDKDSCALASCSAAAV